MVPIPTHLFRSSARLSLLEVQIIMQSTCVHELIISVTHDRVAKEVEAMYRMSVAPGQLVVWDMILFFVGVDTQDVLLVTCQSNRERGSKS